MKIGATKRILITFNSTVLTNINDASVVSLSAFLFVENRVLLKFSKDPVSSFDGAILAAAGQPNIGVINLTHELSKKLIPGKLKMEVWLAKTVDGNVEYYDFTIDVATVEASVK